MRFATSFFNATLLKKNWQRFWPIWGLYSVIWLLQMPVNLLLTAAEYSQDNAWQATALQHTAQRFGTCGEAVPTCFPPVLPVESTRCLSAVRVYSSPTTFPVWAFC